MPRIMIVDDEQNILHAVKRALADESYTLEMFTSAAEGLMRAAAAPFDLVISDYRMPEMDGIMFLKQFKKIQPGAVRLILSGNYEFDVLKAAINEVEIYRYVNKPWVDYDLTTTVAHALWHQTLLIQNQRLVELGETQQKQIDRQQAMLNRLQNE